VRNFFEPRFGYDFSHVRIHTDARAAASARAVNALAYTVGRNIAFGDGRYTPETLEGKRLLAHELTHVVQQLGRGNSAMPRKRLGAQPLAREQPQAQMVISRAQSQSSKQPNGGLGDGSAFELWWKKIAGYEGSLADWERNKANKYDRGGKTNWGVTWGTYKDIAIWVGLDPSEGAFRAMTLAQAALIGMWFWKKAGCDKIRNTGIAVVVADWYWVSMGHAIRRIKRVVNSLGRRVRENMVMDPETIEIINMLEPDKVIAAITNARLRHFDDIIKRDPSQKRFEKGWKRRARERQEQAMQVAGVDQRYPTPSEPASPTASQLIDKYTRWWNLDEKKLADELRSLAPDQLQLVIDVLDALTTSNDDDDVAYEFIWGSDNARLKALPLVVRKRLKQALKAGWVTPVEQAALRRLEEIEGQERPQAPSGSQRQGKGAKRSKLKPAMQPEDKAAGGSNGADKGPGTQTEGMLPTAGSSAAAQMSRLLAVARNSNKPRGKCYKAVKRYINAAGGYGNIKNIYEDDRFLGYQHYARNFHEAMQKYGPAKFRLEQVVANTPFDAPTGAIVVVAPGSPGTRHPSAGDITVAGGNSEFYNDGVMRYRGPKSWPPQKGGLLGVYRPQS
jgi:lysozyme family protein